MLIRKNSPYNYPNFILGIYDDRQKADDAKIEYLKIEDLYSKQVYFKVDLMRDVTIKEVDVHGEEKGFTYVVIDRSSGCGQVLDFYNYIGTDKEFAFKFAYEEMIKEGNEMCCYRVLKFKKNRNYFDPRRIRFWN